MTNHVASLHDIPLVECAPGTFEVFDYSEEDTEENVLNRITVCRCCLDGGEPGQTCASNETGLSKWECWTEKEVFDLEDAGEPCEDYGIDSGDSCAAFCSDIDPSFYEWGNKAGKVTCSCAGTEICSESGAFAMRTSSFVMLGSSLTLMLAFVVGL